MNKHPSVCHRASFWSAGIRVTPMGLARWEGPWYLFNSIMPGVWDSGWTSQHLGFAATSHLGFAAWVAAASLLAGPWFAIRSTSPIHSRIQQHSFNSDHTPGHSSWQGRQIPSSKDICVPKRNYGPELLNC